VKATRILLVCFLAIVSTSALVSAQITPVGVTASSSFGEYVAVSLINNSGLTGGVHDDVWQNMWMGVGTDLTPWLVFDLGQEYDLTAIDVWQYLSSIDLNRGVDGFSILVSDDGVTFTPAGSGNLAVGSGSTTTAQTVAFNATGRYVRFEVTSNHGGFYTGLSEVKFRDTVIPVELQSFSVE